MLKLYGLANTTMFELDQNLRALGVKWPIRALGFGPWEPADLRGFLIVPTVDLLARRLDLLAEKPVVVAVVDMAVKLTYLQPGIEVLDVVPDRGQAHRFTFCPVNYHKIVADVTQVRAQYKTGSPAWVQVEKHELELIPQLLANTQATVLQPILTWMYQLKDTSDRAQKAQIIYQWLVTDEGPEQLEQRLPLGLGTKTLVEWLCGDTGSRTRAMARALKQSRDKGGTPNMESLAQAHKLSLYDVKYIDRQLRTSNLYTPK